MALRYVHPCCIQLGGAVFLDTDRVCIEQVSDTLRGVLYGGVGWWAIGGRFSVAAGTCVVLELCCMLTPNLCLDGAVFWDVVRPGPDL